LALSVRIVGIGRPALGADPDWLLTCWVRDAFDGSLIAPLLGLIFLPLTTVL
jgi:hypothetical protein